MYKPLNGLTCWICFGSYGGFGIKMREPFLLRICLGWVSFVMITMDVENTLEYLMKEQGIWKEDL